MVSALRMLASRSRTRALGIRPIAATPYATHMPVLIALAGVVRPRRVLELGSGPFSTSLFLDKDVFPDLETLVSYEDDAEWAPVVMDAVGTDARLDFRMVDEVRGAVPVDDLDSFDLIFIDDSRTAGERSQTIRTVAAARPRGVMVIHDYETRHYRAASKSIPQRVVAKAFTPQVGVCWRPDTVAADFAARVQQALATVERNRETAPVDDLEAWKGLLGS